MQTLPQQPGATSSAPTVTINVVRSSRAHDGPWLWVDGNRVGDMRDDELSLLADRLERDLRDWFVRSCADSTYDDAVLALRRRLLHPAWAQDSILGHDFGIEVVLVDRGFEQ